MTRARLIAGALTLGALTAGCFPATTVAPPEPPGLAVVESPTASAQQLLRGTKPASTAVDVDGAEVAPLDEATTWTALVDLVEGTNNITVTTRDALGQSSTPNVVTIILDTEPPDAPVIGVPDISVLPLRTLDATLEITGAVVNPSDRLVVDGAVVATSGAGFTIEVPLPVIGRNEIRLAARDIAGNESDVVEIPVLRVEDADPPVLNVASPADGDAPLVLDAITVSGSVADADLAIGGPVTVTVCADDGAGACVCTDDSGGCTPPVVAGVDAPVGDTATFSATIDDVAALAPGAPDDAVLPLLVTAVDEWGNAVSVGRAVLRAQGPGTLAGSAGAEVVAVAAGGAPFDAAAAFLVPDGGGTGTLELAVDDGGGYSPVVDAAAFGAGVPLSVGAVALARDPRAASPAVVHVAWADHLAHAVVYRQHGSAPGGGALGAEETVAGGGVTPVDAESVSLALLDDGAPVVAFVDDVGAVQVARRAAAGAWDPAVTVSDAVTAAASPPGAQHVGLAATPGTHTVTVVWQETTDRDGDGNDDADIVAVRFDLDGAPGAPALVSGDSGAFVDGASTAPCIAALTGGAAAVGWIDEGAGAARAVVATVDDAFFAAPAAHEPVVVAGAGATTGLALAADPGGSAGDAVAVLVDDDVDGLLLRFAAPSALDGPAGAPRVVGPVAALSPAIALAGAVAHVAYVDGGDVRVLPRELP